MIEYLRDPMWNSISAIAAIIALIYAVYQSNNKQKINVRNISTNLGRIFFGSLVFFLGPPLEFTVTHLLVGGLPDVFASWQRATSPGVLEGNVIRVLLFSLFVGSVVVSTIPKNNPKNLLPRTIIVSIMALWAADILLFVFEQAFSSLFFSMISDVFGGVIGGIITLRLIKIFDDIF